MDGPAMAGANEDPGLPSLGVVPLGPTSKIRHRRHPLSPEILTIYGVEGDADSEGRG